MREKRENGKYLPGQVIPADVSVFSDLREALRGAEIIVGAMPAAHAREIYAAAIPYLMDGVAIVSATKGLEPATRARMSEVIAQAIAQHVTTTISVLSGPSFAMEAARGEPTAVVLACEDDATAQTLQACFAGPTLRLYTNRDVLGVELAGAMKNVIAIAAGACSGLGLGTNSLAALITRGLAEMARLAARLGAKPETMSGLAGLGDLVLTCTGTLSRNRYVGSELAKGRDLKEILAGMKMVAEGIGTAAALLDLATEANVELPITEQVNAILHEGKSPADAIRDVMERPSKRE